MGFFDSVANAIGNIVDNIGGIAGSVLGGWGGAALGAALGPVGAAIGGSLGSSLGGSVGNALTGGGSQAPSYAPQIGQIAGTYALGQQLAPPPGPYNNSYTVPNLPSIANATTNAISSLSNPLAPYSGQLNNAINSGLASLAALQNSIASATPAIQSAYSNAAGYANNAASQLSPLASSLAAAGQSVWNTAQDPQQALYNRTLNQVEQQQNAQQAARGIAMSPIGAELANQAISNFNIDWQNQQLARQLAGLQGLASANTGAGNLYAQGANLANAAAQNAYLGTALPFQLGLTAATAPLGLLSSAYPLLNAGNVANAAQAGLGMQYLGLGDQSAALGLNAAFGQAPNVASGLASATNLGTQLGSQLGNSIGNALANASQPSVTYDPNANYYSAPYVWNTGTSGSSNAIPYTWNTPLPTGQTFSDFLSNPSGLPTSLGQLDPVNNYFSNTGSSMFSLGSY